MKKPFKFLVVLTLFFYCGNYAFAQTPSVTDLINEGNKLQGQKKYDEAIAKFNEALKIDPENANAEYELAYALFANKKGLEGIPYLEKVVKSTHKGLIVAAYSLMGTIYDEAHQPQKAIDAFNEGIKLAPGHPQIYYNQGLAYFRNQQYAEAELDAIEAIKHDPKNASNQRLYALVTFHQNKRVNALLGFCSFLLIEPTGPRATEAYTNIQSILKGGVLKDDKGNVPKEDKESAAMNAGLTAIVAAGQAKKLLATDLLEYELKGIFTQTGQASEKKTDKTFFDKFFADYLYKLAQSNNMPPFTHMVAEHTPITGDLKDWVDNMERGF